MSVAILVAVAGMQLVVDVEEAPALGWRFWTFAGFPGDPVEPRPYGGSRGIPLAMISVDGRDRWLVAMEADDSAQLFTPHELFPCADQEGASEFGARWTASHLQQPVLFGGAST